MLDRLNGAERMLLLKFVCAFAWADLDVSDKERKFVERLVDKLKLTDDEARDVEQWLHVSPAPHSIDAGRVPKEHRRVFIDAIRAVIYADGKIDPDERDSFDRLKTALGDDAS